jgi:DNA (cytosine-5)-methyltransferase 1
MGWENVFQCENDPFCRRVLKYHFPQCELFSDIKTSDFSKYENTIDVLTGGFPCQPFSYSGKRKGTDDDRYLWPEVLRAVKEVRPRWFVGENVCGLLTGQRGVVFEQVCADMENAGYDVQPFVIPACAVGAPHRRDRVWIVANRANAGIEGMQQRRENGIYEPETVANASGIYAERYGHEKEGRANGASQRKRNVADNGCAVYFGGEGIVTNADSKLQKRRNGYCLGKGQQTDVAKSFSSARNWDGFPAKSPVCTKYDGFPGQLADIAFSEWRWKSIKALGNGVVPQVVYQIFKAIEEVSKIISNQ